MNHLEKYRGSSFTGNESTVGFSINSTMDTLVMTSYLLLVLFFGLWTIFMLFALGWIFVPIYNKAEVVTLPEYLMERFGSLRIHLCFSFFFLLVYVFNRISMEIGFGAMFLKMVWDTDIYQTMLVVLIITGSYTITAFGEVGGYRGLVKKYLVAIPTRTQEGNWTAKTQCYMPRQDAFRIFRSVVSGDIPWPGLILGTTTVSMFYGCADQTWSPVYYGELCPSWGKDQVACVVPSECQKFCGRGTGCSVLAYPMLVIRVMPSGLKGFMMSTVCASVMSSLTSIFNSSSALFTLNIYTWIRPTATEKELMVAGRFFVIVLLAITIVWIPTIEMVSSETLFEFMQVLKSCLTPSVTAVFLLAVFCKRVNEKGAFWGLILGTSIGIFRLVAEFSYGHTTCEGGRKCPLFICSLHYLYFGFLVFLITLLVVLAISLATKPIADKHLLGLCWSLRNSPQGREALAKALRWKTCSSATLQQGMFGEAQSCFWKSWDLCCGLDKQPSSKIGPDNANEEKPGTSWERLGSSELSADLEALARRIVSRQEEEHKEKLRDWSDTPESPFWKRVVNVSGIILFALLILVHVYFA
ncbi:sodium/glucose cotransporter 1-like protein [Cricetulus griseus]|nr:sodium/glucose cotransporter 1-like protein [Cricetulus griseus]